VTACEETRQRCRRRRGSHPTVRPQRKASPNLSNASREASKTFSTIATITTIAASDASAVRPRSTAVAEPVAHATVPRPRDSTAGTALTEGGDRNEQSRLSCPAVTGPLPDPTPFQPTPCAAQSTLAAGQTTCREERDAIESQATHCGGLARPRLSARSAWTSRGQALAPDRASLSGAGSTFVVRS
jgi:hypothetical protein